jgi:hypothetical protein
MTSPASPSIEEESLDLAAKYDGTCHNPTSHRRAFQSSEVWGMSAGRFESQIHGGEILRSGTRDKHTFTEATVSSEVAFNGRTRRLHACDGLTEPFISDLSSSHLTDLGAHLEKEQCQRHFNNR